jgi:uncharacterized protein (TIGR03437 family)
MLKPALDLVALIASFIHAQSGDVAKPIIHSVVNAATMAPPNSFGPGTLRVITGMNLSPGIASAMSTPLPTELLGVSVFYNGTRAPLLYVSPTQINLQSPSLQEAVAMVTVHNGSASSDAVTVERGRPPDLGVFTLDGSGCGPSHVYNLDSAGDLTLNSAQNSAAPGSVITLFGTGLYTNQPYPDGVPTPTDPSTPMSLEPPVLRFRDTVIGTTLFAGRAPGLVGVDQYNVQLNSAGNSTMGCGLPVHLADFGASSQTFPLSIQSNGGVCEDHPAPVGSITWRKVVHQHPPPSVSRESLEINLTDQPILLPAPVEQGFRLQGLRRSPPVPCAAVERLRRLDAGPASISGPSYGPAVVSPTRIAGEPHYLGTLPPGAIQPGTLTISFAGSGSFGPMAVATPAPEPISISTAFHSGQRPLLSELVINWSGGDIESGVSAVAINAVSGVKTALTAPASRGFLTFAGTFSTLPGRPGPLVDKLTVYQYHRPALPALLGLGGFLYVQREVVYEWRYDFTAPAQQP